jgi:hypothetical protein
MASGDTLCSWTATNAELPSSNFAQIDTRNNNWVEDFDTTTAETVYFRGTLPRNYSGGGITVYVESAAASATSGTIGWLVAIERVTATQDLDSDGFASDQTITATTVSGTSGITTKTGVSISSGANMDNLAAGESFRLRVTRDVTNDNASGDAQLVSVEIKET